MRFNGRGSRERVNAGLPREGGRCQEKPSRKESGIFVKKTPLCPLEHKTTFGFQTTVRGIRDGICLRLKAWCAGYRRETLTVSPLNCTYGWVT